MSPTLADLSGTPRTAPRAIHWNLTISDYRHTLAIWPVRGHPSEFGYGACPERKLVWLARPNLRVPGDCLASTPDFNLMTLQSYTEVLSGNGPKKCPLGTPTAARSRG